MENEGMTLRAALYKNNTDIKFIRIIRNGTWRIVNCVQSPSSIAPNNACLPLQDQELNLPHTLHTLSHERDT